MLFFGPYIDFLLYQLFLYGLWVLFCIVCSGWGLEIFLSVVPLGPVCPVCMCVSIYVCVWVCVFDVALGGVCAVFLHSLFRSWVSEIVFWGCLSCWFFAPCGRRFFFPRSVWFLMRSSRLCSWVLFAGVSADCCVHRLVFWKVVRGGFVACSLCLG